MQILGKKSKILLIAVAITMLVTIGVSFAMWDMSAVKATNGDLSNYANAKVGETIFFGNYYQTNTKDNNGEYIKTPIEWIVVDKDERTGQLTLMSKYILACGSYFGNYYFNKDGVGDYHYKNDNKEIGSNPNNQAYVDSTVRAYLNNLERLDLGGDTFNADTGYIPSGINSTINSGLLSNVGFSNKRYWTKLTTASGGNINNILSDPKSGLYKREDFPSEIYYQRPITNQEYKDRPATRGFYDEAFTNDQKSMIVPKTIAGYIGHRWPDNAFDVSTKSYIEGSVDKVWLPSASELNIMNGQDWNKESNGVWANPSDETSCNVFEYFKNYQKYGYSSVANAVKTTRTEFAKNSFAMNYSIPIYQKESTSINTDINSEINSSDHYWTRTPMSYWFYSVHIVNSSGLFSYGITYRSNLGVRPCVILKY